MTIMEIKYKDHTIKVSSNPSNNQILYKVWKSKNEYWGFKHTITDAKRWIDKEIQIQGERKK